MEMRFSKRITPAIRLGLILPHYLENTSDPLILDVSFINYYFVITSGICTVLPFTLAITKYFPLDKPCEVNGNV